LVLSATGAHGVPAVAKTRDKNDFKTIVVEAYVSVAVAVCNVVEAIVVMVVDDIHIHVPLQPY
jgi:hypothetical protein